MDVILVPVGADLYAVPIGWVREVVIAPPLTRLVTAPPVVLGLFNLRGEIVPLLDAASLLGIGRIDTVAFALVLHSDLGPVGLGATAFPERAFLDEPVGPSELTTSFGSYRVGDRLAVLLDVEALLSSVTLPAAPSADVPELELEDASLLGPT
jgi:purine-binding chemotaxis protein CheW